MQAHHIILIFAITIIAIISSNYHILSKKTGLYKKHLNHNKHQIEHHKQSKNNHKDSNSHTHKQHRLHNYKQSEKSHKDKGDSSHKKRHEQHHTQSLIHHRKQHNLNKKHHSSNNKRQHDSPNHKHSHRHVHNINSILISPQCSTGQHPRIIEGSTANETSFLHAAVIYFCEGQVQAVSVRGCKQWCGGSVISSLHILTAAHCMFTSGNFQRPIQRHEVLVRIDVKNLSTPEILSGDFRTTYQTQQIIVHEHYRNGDPRLLNDIALVKLMQPMLFSTAICINGLHLNYNLFVNPNVIVAGWGKFASGGPMSNVLKFAKLHVSNCNYYNVMHFCAKAPYHVYGYTCEGDSGSGVLPLQRNGDPGNLLVGIVSSGEGYYNYSTGVLTCLPTMSFVNVSTYAQWINDHVVS